MPNPAIPRDVVHTLAEACGNDPTGHAPTASRLLKDQRRLSRFFEQNAAALGPVPAQVALYMLSGCLRVFEQVGGRMSKVTHEDLDRAEAHIAARVDALLPADAGLAARAKAIEDRAQPHLLDEILWALYERGPEDQKEGEADIDPQQSAIIYLALWTAVEAIDMNWRPPAGYGA